MKIITPEQLLDLSDAAGRIIIKENLEISCLISWETCGQIASLRVGGDMSIDGNLYWSRLAMPQVGGKMTYKRILPSMDQHEHWRDRLAEFGVEIGKNDCYEVLIPRVQAKLDEILASEKWIPVERWILESLKNTG